MKVVVVFILVDHRFTEKSYLMIDSLTSSYYVCSSITKKSDNRIVAAVWLEPQATTSTKHHSRKRDVVVFDAAGQ